jgi:hypothetical protein
MTPLHAAISKYFDAGYRQREVAKREASVAALLALRDPVAIKHALMTSRGGRILRQEFPEMDLDELVAHCVDASGGMRKRRSPRYEEVENEYTGADAWAEGGEAEPGRDELDELGPEEDEDEKDEEMKEYRFECVGQVC